MLVDESHIELEIPLSGAKTCHIQWLQHAGCVRWHAANMHLVIVEIFQRLVAQGVRAIPIKNQSTPPLSIWQIVAEMDNILVESFIVKIALERNSENNL